MLALEAVLAQGFGAGLMLGALLTMVAGRPGTMAAAFVGVAISALGLWFGN